MNRGIALLFLGPRHYIGGGEVSPTPWPPLPPGKTRYRLYKRLGEPQFRSGQLLENLVPTRTRSRDHPAHSAFAIPTAYSSGHQQPLTRDGPSHRPTISARHAVPPTESLRQRTTFSCQLQPLLPLALHNNLFSVLVYLSSAATQHTISAITLLHS